MEQINEIYGNLTGVDIEKQRQLWDERGKGYFGEYLVFQELYKYVPGYGKILMNLEVPSGYGKTTEIDLVFIHETGLYVFEIKHYKGTIYGKSGDERWTQYFRTVNNSHFYSPIKQNEGHIRSLKIILPSAKYTSFVVFTNQECDIRVENSNPDVIVCKLDELGYKFSERIRNTNVVYGIDDIESIFSELLPFSPSMNSIVTVDGEEAPLAAYIGTFNKEAKDTQKDEKASPQVLPLADYVNEIRSNYQRYAKLIYEDADKKVKRTKRIAVLVACCFLALGGLAAYISNLRLQSSRASFEEQLNDMKRNFQHVEAYNAGDIVLSNEFVEVTQSTLSKSKEYANASDFSAKIRINSDSYHLQFTDETKYIVMMADGSVKEYDMFLDGGFMNPSSTISKNLAWNGPVDFGKMVFFEANADDIKYVKLKNVTLCDILYKAIKSDIELELYSTY